MFEIVMGIDDFLIQLVKYWSWECNSISRKSCQRILNYSQETGRAAHQHTPSFTSCPTITISNKKTTERRHLRPFNRKRRNSFITDSNCRTASLSWGGRTQFDLIEKKIRLL